MCSSDVERDRRVQWCSSKKKKKHCCSHADLRENMRQHTPTHTHTHTSMHANSRCVHCVRVKHSMFPTVINLFVWMKLCHPIKSLTDLADFPAYFLCFLTSLFLPCLLSLPLSCFYFLLFIVIIFTCEVQKHFKQSPMVCQRVINNLREWLLVQKMKVCMWPSVLSLLVNYF